MYVLFHSFFQYELYLRAFYKLYSYKKIENVEDEMQYSNLVKQLLDDHKDVVTSLAKAIQQVRTQVRVSSIFDKFFKGNQHW